MCFGNAQHENRIFMVCENFLLVKRNQTIYDGIRLDSRISGTNVVSYSIAENPKRESLHFSEDC